MYFNFSKLTNKFTSLVASIKKKIIIIFKLKNKVTLHVCKMSGKYLNNVVA